MGIKEHSSTSKKGRVIAASNMWWDLSSHMQVLIIYTGVQIIINRCYEGNAGEKFE